MKIQGKYNSAEIFTDAADEESIRLVYRLLSNPACADSRIAIMPDIHTDFVMKPIYNYKACDV